MILHLATCTKVGLAFASIFLDSLGKHAQHSVCLFAGFLAICGAIGAEVRNISAEALREQPGDRVLALMVHAESENRSLRDKNHAVWALGQLGDPRALPVLEKYYTGKPCDHSRFLCQKELKKAIEACKGGFNITAYFRRTDQ